MGMAGPCLQVCLLISGCLFGVGIVLLATAQNIAMVVIGRVLMGGGVGFANSVSKSSLLPAHDELWRMQCI